jgi:long-chain acyl-CoA synthetase
VIIGETLDRNRRFYPNRIAITDGVKRFTYKQFVDRTFSLMHALLDLGLAKGDRVACLLSNIPEYMELYFAIPGCGMIIVPLNFRLAPNELKYILENAGVSAIFVEPQFVKNIEVLRPTLKGIKAYVCVGGAAEGYLDYERLVSSYPTERPAGIEVNENDVADLTYTSGTTGRPKGVMLTHRNIVTQIFQTFSFSMKFSGVGDCVMCTYPIFHVGVLPALAGLALGIKSVTLNFNPLKMYEIIQNERVTAWGVPPVMLDMLYNSGVDPGRYDLSSMETLIVAGQPSLLPTVKRTFEVFPSPTLVYVTSLGISETFTFNTLSHITRENLPEVERLIATLPVKTAAVPVGLHGVYPHVDMKIVDDQRNEVGTGIVGEMAFKGEHVMKGYWKNPEATAEVLDEDGWYYSGDMGLWHPDKPYCSFVVDRKKDMIVSGSENVYPAEVELAILQHPAVESVCVFGVPDSKWGETVKAAVVLKPGIQASAEGSINHCRAGISSY